jgi:hypothetical protein
MVDVHLADGTTITATDRHPFWDATAGEFTYAIDLRPGDKVREIDGTLLTIAGTRVYDADVTAYNLTVDGIHTYYAGTTPVLVHNSCFQGGRYADLDTGNGIELHHMPADSVSSLSRGQGPAIQMSRADHYQTASWGRSASATGYRAEQQALIDQGRFDDAIQMDINDVTSKFPGTYHNAILQMIGSL